MGHGGTLDPAASGVLIVGIGKGTKQLGGFLDCTKRYEAVVLFGAATDSYDDQGKIIGRRSYSHIQREAFESALGKWRGKGKQKPPIFSALKMDGKKLYEYAREGKEPPRNIEERDVEVSDLECVEWMEGGSHTFKAPEEEVEGDAKEGALKILRKEGELADGLAAFSHSEETAAVSGKKRSREDENAAVEVKRAKSGMEAELAAAGTISEEHDVTNTDEEIRAIPKLPSETPTGDAVASDDVTNSQVEELARPHEQEDKGAMSTSDSRAISPGPPAARICMTVSGGFYVRSLCHDLGLALDTFGLMANLVRLRQGDFRLDDENIFDYKDLEAGEEAWAPKLEKQLRNWQEKTQSER